MTDKEKLEQLIEQMRSCTLESSDYLIKLMEECAKLLSPYQDNHFVNQALSCMVEDGDLLKRKWGRIKDNKKHTKESVVDFNRLKNGTVGRLQYVSEITNLIPSS